MAGFEVSYAIDMWAKAVATYNHNHEKKVAECVDIHSLTDEQLVALNKNNDVIGVIGGPPCQGFSKVGTRDVNDPRNHLYLEYYRVVKLVLPEFFVIENVSGLLTLSKGLFRDDIVERFGKLGYEVAFQEVVASDYGVPQNRHRVFFVGMKKKKFVFPSKILPFLQNCGIVNYQNVAAIENKKFFTNIGNAYVDILRSIKIIKAEEESNLREEILVKLEKIQEEIYFQCLVIMMKSPDCNYGYDFFDVLWFAMFGTK